MLIRMRIKCKNNVKNAVLAIFARKSPIFDQLRTGGFLYPRKKVKYSCGYSYHIYSILQGENYF